MYAPPCSCRTGTKETDERDSDSLKSSVSSPGIPKTYSTPSASRQSTKTSDARRKVMRPRHFKSANQRDVKYLYWTGRAGRWLTLTYGTAAATTDLSTNSAAISSAQEHANRVHRLRMDDDSKMVRVDLHRARRRRRVKELLGVELGEDEAV